MKLFLRTITGESFDTLDFTEISSVLDVKKFLHPFFAAATINLCHKGRILNDEKKTLQDCGVKEENLLVIAGKRLALQNAHSAGTNNLPSATLGIPSSSSTTNPDQQNQNVSNNNTTTTTPSRMMANHQDLNIATTTAAIQSSSLPASPPLAPTFRNNSMFRPTTANNRRDERIWIFLHLRSKEEETQKEQQQQQQQRVKMIITPNEQELELPLLLFQHTNY